MANPPYEIIIISILSCLVILITLIYYRNPTNQIVNFIKKSSKLE